MYVFQLHSNPTRKECLCYHELNTCEYFKIKKLYIYLLTILEIFFIKLINDAWETGSFFLFLKGNAQFVQNTTFGPWEKMIAQLRQMFCKILMNTRAPISVMLLCLFVYAEALLDFKGRFENRCSWKFHKITGKHLWWSLFRRATVNFAKFSRTPIL